MKTLLASFLLLFIASSTVISKPKLKYQPYKKVFTLGVIDEVASEELAEKRTLNIYLPEGYDTAVKKKYPVIYLLDGSANEDFVHVCGLVQFLTMIEAMPQTIVVGIANVDRRRDFTFPTTVAKDKADYPTTGSSEKFIRFIENDLQPFIARKYRTNHTTTIIGQSLGGLLAAEILLKKPTLFSNYIIVSPSLWWDNESLLAKAHALLKALPDNDMKIYLSVGSEGDKMEGDAAKFRDLLLAQNKKNIQVMFNPMPKENHLTILHNSLYEAFQKLHATK